MAGSRHQPALLGGLFIGVLAALPIVNLPNCCCLWVITGGLLTVYLQQKNQDAPVETSQAVLGGLLAGLIGAVISSALDAILLALFGDIMRQWLERIVASQPDMPPQLHDFLNSQQNTQGLQAAGQLIKFLFKLPVYAIFGMLGALLGTALFRKKVPPAAAPPAHV